MGENQELKQTETRNTDDRVYDITIIGGGPVGLFSAFYAGIRDMSTKIIDSLPQLGGQLAELYPDKYIYDVAGFPKIYAKDLIANLKEQMAPYHPTVCLNERVLKLEKQPDGIFRLTSDTTVHLAKTVLIAGGIGAFTPRRLPAENAAQFEGKGIRYFIDDVSKFKGMNCLVVGGGDSAADFALMLEEVAQKVTLIHRRDQFRAHEDSVRRLFASSVEVKVFTELKSVSGEGKLQKAVLVNSKDKTEEEIPVDTIIGALGFSASLGPILEWGLEIQDNAIVVNTKGETNIPGVYAVGDIVTYPGKIKLIATGFGEGPTAVNNAKIYLDPQSKLHPGHSSSGFGKH
ncbi:NAD(P)/FAD-dependent oxidoreductase [Effusibacillus dendaii]|uniref:Ferredoxin--NADP reductase n=1 Tax=Effusibacillus dendaii TaxID=2743772 RepID=A0A7I8D769_9BACL|nr:NAD(P)/FAD-dependent oxidoreductase [Effusibacillus dendaii]BCJ85915.1 ferredoxin--NADP reductase [Effusibacillus dendaii]